MASIRSPEPHSAADPFELQRLAEELAEREATSPPVATAFDEVSKAERDLPIYVPLSHENPYLRAEAFNVEEFLLSRAYTSLPDLRLELRDYLATLKEELVRLINDDYEAFISLSTDLRGEGARLERMKAPLKDLKYQVLTPREQGTRKILQDIQDNTEQKLKERSKIREQKAFLHLLLKISESITRLESLLLITVPSDGDRISSEVNALRDIHRSDDRGPDDRTRANRAKHLARVASEYTQLLYHVFRAREYGSAFIDESQWRVDRIKSTLSSDLDHLFASTLVALAAGREQGRETKASELERSKWVADVTECLRTYDMLGLWRDAEDVLRKEVVRDFVKKTIHPNALSTPHSPIVPHTPFAPSSAASGARPHTPLPTATHPPRTPYTPFTAFASKQNPFALSLHPSAGGAEAAPPIHMLDDRDDSLAALYNAVLRFVDRDLKRVMEIAEGVCAKSGARGRREAGEQGAGFEVMANVVWAEVGRAIMDELGSVVFAAGKPDEFRKHHETTQAFTRALEFLAPSLHSIEVMRAHPTYTAFERRWQLPVYFQLRWKEIVTKVEESLATTRLERLSSKAIAPFVTAQAAIVWDAINTCWSAEVYIPELSHRFWKLTLQLISRYKAWLDNSLPAFEPPSKVAAAVAAEKMGLTPGSPANLPRAATPNLPTEAASPESTAVDEISLQQFSTAIIDIKAMDAEVVKLWREELSVMMPESIDDGSDENIGPEAEPSYFVSLIFRPVRTFFGVGSADGPGAPLRDELLQSYAEEIFEIVTQRYIHFLSAMKKTEESLRRLKKNKKTSYSLFGSSSSRDDDGRADEEKIRVQMVLDVEAFGKDAESLGVSVQQSETFKILREMAGSTLTDAAEYDDM
ncbi:predicted protein [Postia placenta Mad-698-R]|uniref:Conserved oligomeric Golgi complex subunit 2 n=1 Tax=Postia placenta MAD-698-R-SB12 TaxID=670580 RepID=A0A1X6NBJ0_9APHY|nr:hypothetical protein POSPLADRAFT_1177460 [Postia placenta MAD-698-R-SB12]EED79251.1 predicted protein [Postia placenta Mad-698-R]OSX66008.1 hypothetical protein POSPLADRAFT_1177460 [Postia placenta MAD-698-R-SB12]